MYLTFPGRSTEAIGSHESGIARFYSGLSTAILLGPVLRFGDTFAHGTAVAVSALGEGGARSPAEFGSRSRILHGSQYDHSGTGGRWRPFLRSA